MKIDVGAFLKAAANIATGQIAGQMDAENLIYQRQQKQAEDQLRQFQIGSQIENLHRDDIARGISETTKLGQYVAPEERGRFFGEAAAASARNYNAPGIYTAEALQNLLRPGGHLPQAAPNMQAPSGQQAAPLSPAARAAIPGQIQGIRQQFEQGVAGTPAETYPSPPGQGAFPGSLPPSQVATAPQPGGMLPPAAPTPSGMIGQPAGSAPGQELQQQIGQGVPPFSPQQNSLMSSLYALRTAQPQAPQAGPYVAALQGQQQAMAGAQMGAAAAATGSGGAPGGAAPPTGPASTAGARAGGAVGATPPATSPTAGLSPGAEAGAAALQAPPQPVVKGPAGLGWGLDPNDLHPAAQAAEVPGSTFKPPWGGEYHLSELNKGEGKEIAGRVAQAAKALATADLGGDPNAQTYYRLGKDLDLGREPRTRAELDRMAQALKYYQLAGAGKNVAVARLQLNEQQEYKKGLLANGMNAESYRDAHQDYLARRSANPRAAGVDLLGDQREYPLLEQALKSRDEALQRGDNQAAETYNDQANDYADTIKASIAADKSPAQQARDWQNFDKMLARASPESFTPESARKAIHAAGLDAYFAGIPDERLMGSLFGARAEKLTDAFNANMTKVGRLTPEAQHLYLNRVQNLMTLLGEGGPALKVPAEIVLQLTPAELKRYHYMQLAAERADKNLAFTGRKVDVAEAHEKLLEQTRKEARALGGVPVTVRMRPLEYDYKAALGAYNKAISPAGSFANYQQDLEQWDRDHVKQGENPKYPGETTVPPPATTTGQAGMWSLWNARNHVHTTREKLQTALDKIVTERQQAMTGAGQPAGTGATVRERRPPAGAGTALPKAVSNDQYSFNEARRQGRSEAFILKAWQRGLLHP